MLSIFRRHTDACEASYKAGPPAKCERTGRPLATRPRGYKKCDCPIHVEGTMKGVMYRRNLGTKVWTAASLMVREIEARQSWDDPNAVKTVKISDAMDAFLGPLMNKSLRKSKSTLRMLRAALLSSDAAYRAKANTRTYTPALLEFTAAKGLTTVDQLTLPVLTEYMGQVICSPNTYIKRTRNLKRFLWHCVRSEYHGVTVSHPALQKDAFPMPSKEKTSVKTKKPFEAAELESIEVTARQLYGDSLAALAAVMRYSGLRISDAATLKASHIQSGVLMLDQMYKTKDPLNIPVHPAMAAALAKVTPNAAGYYFWSGESEVSTATDNWRVRFVEVFKACGLDGAHPHRFRHTFAVTMLVRGVSMDLVSRALGHSSIKVTEKHYALFDKSRLAQLHGALNAAYAIDAPILTPAPALAGAATGRKRATVTVLDVGVAA